MGQPPAVQSADTRGPEALRISPSWLLEYGGVTWEIFEIEILHAIRRVLVHLCEIFDESHFIISSKSGNRDRNGTRHEKLDKMASHL